MLVRLRYGGVHPRREVHAQSMIFSGVIHRGADVDARHAVGERDRADDALVASRIAAGISPGR